jgi:hypothetical protein
MTSPMTGHSFEQRLLEQVRERAHRYFPGLDPAARPGLLSKRRRAYSDIYRVAIPARVGPPPELVIKVFPGARAQFDAMTALWPQFMAHPTFGIPRPLDLLEEGPALVMEAVRGTTLELRLPRFAWYGRRLAASARECRAAGTWLRFFHDRSEGMEPALLDTRDRLEGLEASLGRLAAIGLDAEVCRRLDRWLRPLAGRIEGVKLPVSHVHGEFTIDNVLLDDGRLIALDLWRETRGVVAQDLSSFLNSLMLVRLTRPAPWTALRRLRAAFLEGYGGGAADERPVLAFLQGTGVADVAVEILDRRRSRAARAWVAHFLASAIVELRSHERNGRP